MKIVIVHQNLSLNVPGNQFKNNCLTIAQFVSTKVNFATENGLIISSGSRQTQSQVEAIFQALNYDSYEVWPGLNPYPKAFIPEYKISLDIIIEKIIFDAKNRQIDYLVIVLDQDQKDVVQSFFNSICPESSHIGFPEFSTHQVIELDTQENGIKISQPTIQK